MPHSIVPPDQEPPAAPTAADAQGHGIIVSLDPEHTPELHATVWLAPGAVIAGAVSIAADTSVWYNAVVRGDSDTVRIGQRSNVQDGVVIHTQRGDPAVIGDDVSIGHNAVVHGATIENGCLIGMSSTVLSGAVVGTGTLIAAGALVPQNVIIPPHSLVAGVPGRVIRELRPDERQHVRENAAVYLGYTADHRAATRGADPQVEHAQPNPL
ncbi:carbonic anhydrase/acetyltransferase-like protein (isoleucine patch superfamily) [Leucobacter luti]|uniref:gamma carbonic anhydrase family protein n=1 Tax=Leucobacter luti TaxID=340320 RepID=UPI0010D82F72|nr:gamma carbonic anhydrase family protein [Leucobacter luti]MCW2287803.1 carbonic anhydrase/acetyltransferase-like protein (isoleucine patch superfamily) [Leucobacter luti]TCK46034.1 carbonic anhydrase/acetyltransferase-like protein (isoleucine patch superfamily) [Leucobacter luti]